MQTPIPFYLKEILDQAKPNTDGEVADYIPVLAKADPERLGLALCTTTGHVYSVGDDEVEFSIQSISKPFVYALALQELGVEAVKKVVGMEPSGEAFNELSLGEEDHRPVNPMINAGAMTTTQLINGVDSGVEERVERIRSFLSKLAGRELQIDQEVLDSEMEGADRNLSLAHMLRSYGIIEDEAHDAVLTYTQQCAINVTVKDLAIMAATLANGGTNPVTEEKLLDADVCQLTMAVMSSAGMYDGAGRWMANVGIPAKSGVAGGLLGMLPGQLGIASFSPRLNEEGNSVRGVEMFRRLSQDMGLHLMSTEERYGIQPIRNVIHEGADSYFYIQGRINFNAAETILHELFDYDLKDQNVIVDISRVNAVNGMGRRMLKEGLRRLREAGHEIAIVDPDNVMPNLEMRDGTMVPVREHEEALDPDEELRDEAASMTALAEESAAEDSSTN